MKKEILCKKCIGSENYWTERVTFLGKVLLMCKHKLAEHGMETVGDKLKFLEKRRISV